MPQTIPTAAQMFLVCNRPQSESPVVVTGSQACGLVGEGSPEAVVSALAGTTYMDTLSGDFWVKGSGTGNTGWIQLIDFP